MNFLSAILAAKRLELAQTRARTPQPVVERLAAIRPAPRGFTASLDTDGVRIIAEIKRASPSRGDIRVDLDCAAMACAYEAGHAAALSVLTESTFFKGCNTDLQHARAATELPVLRKDFIIDPYQVYETAALGADALLLIVRILDDAMLQTLYTLATELGLDVLCEVFDKQDAVRVRTLGASLVGINNRDLNSFDINLNRALSLSRYLAPGTCTVALSGLHTTADLQQNLVCGIRHFLVGESLMRQPDPAAILRTWTALPVPPQTAKPRTANTP